MSKQEKEIRQIVEAALNCIDFSKVPNRNVDLEEQATPHLRTITIHQYGIGPNIIIDGVCVLDLSIDF